MSGFVESTSLVVAVCVLIACLVLLFVYNMFIIISYSAQAIYDTDDVMYCAGEST